MDNNTRDVLIAFIAGIPAAVAAVSSIRNGHRIKRLGKPVKFPETTGEETSPGKSAHKLAAPDWYQPPDFK
jgi:hypothetical protein